MINNYHARALFQGRGAGVHIWRRLWVVRQPVVRTLKLCCEPPCGQSVSSRPPHLVLPGYTRGRAGAGADKQPGYIQGSSSVPQPPGTAAGWGDMSGDDRGGLPSRAATAAAGVAYAHAAHGNGELHGDIPSGRWAADAASPVPRASAAPHARLTPVAATMLRDAGRCGWVVNGDTTALGEGVRGAAERPRTPSGHARCGTTSHTRGGLSQAATAEARAAPPRRAAVPPAPDTAAGTENCVPCAVAAGAAAAAAPAALPAAAAAVAASASALWIAGLWRRAGAERCRAGRRKHSSETTLGARTLASSPPPPPPPCGSQSPHKNCWAATGSLGGLGILMPSPIPERLAGKAHLQLLLLLLLALLMHGQRARACRPRRCQFFRARLYFRLRGHRCRCCSCCRRRKSPSSIAVAATGPSPGGPDPAAARMPADAAPAATPPTPAAIAAPGRKHHPALPWVWARGGTPVGLSLTAARTPAGVAPAAMSPTPAAIAAEGRMIHAVLPWVWARRWALFDPATGVTHPAVGQRPGGEQVRRTHWNAAAPLLRLAGTAGCPATMAAEAVSRPACEPTRPSSRGCARRASSSPRRCR
eukprot:361250-Chlamydomonas_euryale.AAC.26